MTKYSNMNFLNLFIITSLFTGLLLVTSAKAEDVEILDIQKIKTHDPNSKININYNNWTFLLQATVTRPRVSSRIYAQPKRAGVGTKISFSNRNPTRMEASRVFYHYITEEELEYIKLLRSGMEQLPTVIPLETLNRDEQLAYWLNLYNITVYEQIAAQYPVRNLKKLYKGSRKNSSLWDEKILNVNGIEMSLNDIQHNIIQKIWRDPIVIYGLYQGTIGGPNLRRKAYTGKTVYNQLEDNAEEFVNSLRGLRFRGKTAEASVIYKWNRELFSNFEADLRRHLRKFTNYKLTIRLDASKKIKPKIYDWNIADVLNGKQPSANSAASKNPVAFLLSPGEIGADDFGSGGNFGTIGGIHTEKVLNTAIIRNRLPHDAAVFLRNFIERNKKIRGTSITIEEVDKEGIDNKAQ